MAVRVETEIKLLSETPLRKCDVVAALDTLDGVRHDEPRRAQQADVYLDDAARHLAKQGIGFRLRTRGEDRTLCWKGAQQRRAGVFSRQEVERRWPRRRPPRHADELGGELRSRVEPFVYDGELAPVVELRTDRTEIGIHSDRTRAVLCLDHVETGIPGNGASGMFDELEIELLDGDAAQLAAWAEVLQHRLPLAASKVDKLQRALRLCDVLPNDTDTPLDRATPARETCRRFLAEQLARMQQQELAVRIDTSAEAVHKLRVACRRIRSGLRAFAAHLSPEWTRAVTRTFGRSARPFGRVRDIDVLSTELLATLDDLPAGLADGAGVALELLGAERARLHRKGVRKLQRRKRLAALQRFQAIVDAAWSDTMPTRARTATVAKKVARAATEEVAAAAADGAHHPLRLALKRLRYTCEVFAAAYGDELSRFARRIAELQDHLGILNDAHVAEELLVAWARGEPALTTRAKLAVGAWIGHQRERRRRAAAAFDEAWRSFDLASSTERLMSLLDRRA